MSNEEVKTEETKEKTSWIKTKPAELEKLVRQLSKEGNTPAMIGTILRDKHGIPKTKVFGKKITKILKEEETPYITEKDIVTQDIEKIKKHIVKNKHDAGASRALTKKLWLLYNLNKHS